jgi:arylsulfatase A-like enzyme
MSDRPNFVVMAIDSLRADNLGCYGYRRETSPNMDALSRQGVLAEQFVCAGLPTHPSFTTLYTGQHPITHGIVAHGPRVPLGKDSPFLPQVLLEEGYTTCALDNLATGRQWFRRGFEYYIDPSLRHTMYLDVTCEELNGRAIPWLRTHADEPFFMLIHYWDPHWPWKPPAKYQNLFYQGNPIDPNNHALDRWWQHPLGAVARDTWMRRPEGLITDPDYMSALYDQEIRHVDDGVGQILAALDEYGLADNTVVVIFGDHGESLVEHGIFFDHHGLYDVTLRVPFIARWPRRIKPGSRITRMLQHHDIAPTLIEAAGVRVPDEMDGQSFLGLLTGSSNEGGRDKAVSCECTWQAKWSLRTDRYKLILARGPDLYGSPDRELYDLAADPREERNIAQDQAALTASLEGELEGWIASRLAALGRTEDPLTKHGISLNFQ